MPAVETELLELESELMCRRVVESAVEVGRRVESRYGVVGGLLMGSSRELLVNAVDGVSLELLLLVVTWNVGRLRAKRADQRGVKLVLGDDGSLVVAGVLIVHGVGVHLMLRASWRSRQGIHV